MPSDAPELPQDPREREIFLRALREYSDNCEPPALTPDCPYAVKIGPGLRGCGNECMDLLARHNAPLSHEEIDVGEGLTMRRTRRPRTRQARNPVAGAYDAREIYLSDESSGPPSTWRLAAMLVGLAELFETPPPEETGQASQRLSDISELMKHIEAKGLVFETHVLPRLRAVAGFVVFKEYFLPGNPESGEPTTAPHGWLVAVSEHIESANATQSVEAFSRGIEGILAITTSWASTATWEELVNWSPPSSPSASDVSFAHQHVDSGAWIMERFTRTFLSEWSVSALRSEWRYLHGQLSAPCDSSEMKVREVPAADLARVMADRLGAEPHPSKELTNLLVKPAVTFLEDGRRSEAATLFEAALRHDPTDADALNNLGFCLLPDDPEKALRHLDAAIDSGQADIEITNANRLLALIALGRWTSACDLAESHLDRHADSSPQRSVWLWQIDSVLDASDATLIECEDIGSYVEALRDVATSRSRDLRSTSTIAEQL